MKRYPHKCPSNAPAYTTPWQCDVCGEWVDEVSVTDCPIDWQRTPGPKALAHARELRLRYTNGDT